MKLAILTISTILLFTQLFADNKETKLFTIKTDPSQIHSNNEFKIFVYFNATDDSNLPKVKHEGLGIDIIIPKGKFKKAVKASFAPKLKWVKVNKNVFKMHLGSVAIKGEGESGVNIKFKYDHNESKELTFNDTIKFKLK